MTTPQTPQPQPPRNRYVVLARQALWESVSFAVEALLLAIFVWVAWKFQEWAHQHELDNSRRILLGLVEVLTWCLVVGVKAIRAFVRLIHVVKLVPMAGIRAYFDIKTELRDARLRYAAPPAKEVATQQPLPEEH